MSAAPRALRLHGRGGQGVKLASHVISRSAFIAGAWVQDSPLYGAERRGAPVVASVRLADRPIAERGTIEAPDAILVLDASLIGQPEAAVLEGVGDDTLALVNGIEDASSLQRRFALPGRVIAADLSSLALEVVGSARPSAPAAAFAVRALGIAPWEALEEALRLELGDAGVAGEALERNLDCARRAFALAPLVGFPARQRRAMAPSLPRVMTHLPAREAAPSILLPSTSELRSTAGWRVFRPEIDLQRCTRCALCFALCPEGAIHLASDATPWIDAAHCKGCLVCAHECPTQAIVTLREAAP
jgi:pyruvate ferredoxin oxidoreductase gamma subunit